VKHWKIRLLKWDARISKALQISDKNTITALILKFFAHSGDSWFWLAGLFITWLATSGTWRGRVLFLGVGLAVMAVAVTLLKFSIRRPRPNGDWGQIYRITDPHSFPSGHAARSAALAVMGIAVGPPWFAITLVLWSPWVGISRVALSVHYLSDVVAGWIVGAVMGLVALALQPLILQIFGFLL
jgi:membrane-associated phospholipid phosphatase